MYAETSIFIAMLMVVGAQTTHRSHTQAGKSCRDCASNRNQNGSGPCKGGALEDIKSQFGALQAKIQVLENQVKSDAAKPDKPQFYINFCAPTNENAMDFHILNAMGVHKWPVFCQAISSSCAAAENYDLSISLYNFKGCTRESKDCGHPGVIFNAMDSLTYDFVYFRPHSPTKCYQTGYMQNGQATFSESRYCPAGPPTGQTWANITLYVHGSDWAYLLMDDQLVTIISFHHAVLSRGGAQAANGYNNLVFFKDYRVSIPPVLPIVAPNMVRGCTAGTGWMTSTALVLNADEGTFAQSGFCRVQHSATLSGTISKYEWTVRLFNIRPNVGHPGAMYNLQDMNNFDFVYFRPHSAATCYQTGHVINGAATFVSTGPCPDGPPAGTAGFLLTLKVHSHNNVQIFKNNQHVKTINPNYRVTPRCGVLAANGYKNIIQASSFNLRKL